MAVAPRLTHHAAHRLMGVTRGHSRDRRDRGLRGPLAWPPVPVMMSRRQRFDEAVLDAVSAFERRFGSTLPDLDIAVEDVPPSDPPPTERDVVLGRLFAHEDHNLARVVIYRRPVEARGSTPAEVAAIVHEVVVEHLCTLLGVDPDDFA